jgi:hypothetical protein
MGKPDGGKRGGGQDKQKCRPGSGTRRSGGKAWELPAYRIVGEVFGGYLIVESGSEVNS